MSNLSSHDELYVRSSIANRRVANLFIDAYNSVDVLSATETGYIDGVTAGTCLANLRTKASSSSCGSM